MIIRFILNGKPEAPDVRPEQTLSETLRRVFNLYSVKCGCGAGYCGACSVLLEGSIAPSCLVPMFTVKDRTVVTLEGLAAYEEYGIILDGFGEAGYRPCGYCRPGKILSVFELLKKNPASEEKDILKSLSGHHCRCNEYSSLVRAVTLISLKMRRRRP